MTRRQSVSPLTPGERRGRALSTTVVLFHEAIAARLGMSSAESKCLGFLEEHGPLTPGRLAALSGFTTGAITGIVDRLELAGYVRRTRHVSDRRSVIVHPLNLAKIKRQTAPIFASLGRTMKTVTARYTANELALIDDYLDRITRVLQQETQKLK
jgi:DNA-binding MarR family transcriptional regulator